MHTQKSRHMSPYKKDKYQSPQQQGQQGLSKYLLNDSDIHNDKFSDKLKKQIIHAKIESINSDLTSFCKDRFGDLAYGPDKTTDQWIEIQKTIALVQNLTGYVHRDNQIKKELSLKIRKNQDQNNKLTQAAQRLNRQKKGLEKDKQNLQLKVKSLERQFKQQIQKIKREKQEAQKKSSQILCRQNHYKNQFRKQDLLISQLQDKIKSRTTQKQSVVKNSFQRIQQIQKYGPTIVLSNSEKQFNQFYINNYMTSFKQITQQNEYLKACLKNVYEELHHVLDVRKDIIMKRKGFKQALESQAFQMENVLPETYHLPKDYSKESLYKLNQNLRKFKQAMKISDLVADKVQDEKADCVKNVKNLINNYKNVIQGQDTLINRIVLKSKQYKPNEMHNLQNKYDDDLDKSRKFLQQQREILISRNKQLQLTRKAMKNTIKKAQQQKRLFAKKKAETNQQIQVLKKNIQRIPAMIQEELGSIIP